MLRPILRSSGKNGIILEQFQKEVGVVSKKSVLIYYDFEDQTAALTDAQVGRVIRMVLAYEKRGELLEEVDCEVLMAFRFLRPTLDSNRRKYESMCIRNRKNLGLESQSLPVGTSGAYKDKDKEKDKEKEKEQDQKGKIDQSKRIWKLYQTEREQSGIKNTPR